MAKELLPQLRMELKAVCPIDWATVNDKSIALKLVTPGLDALRRYEISCSMLQEQADTIKREFEMTAQEAKKAATQKEKQVKAEASDAEKVNNEVGMPRLIAHLVDTYKLTQEKAEAALKNWSALDLGGDPKRWQYRDGAGGKFKGYKAIAKALHLAEPSPASGKKRKRPANDAQPN